MSDERPNSLAAQAASWVPPWERAAREPDRAYQAAAAEPDVRDDLDESAPAVAEPEAEGSPGESERIDGSGPAGDGADESFDGPNPPPTAAVRPQARGGTPGEADAGDGGDVDSGSGDDAGSGHDVRSRHDAGSGPAADDTDAEADDGASDDDPASPAEEVPPPLAPLPGEAPGTATVDAPTVLPEEEEPAPTDVGGGPHVPVPAPIGDAIEAAEDDPGAPVDAPLSPDGDDAGDVFDAAADDADDAGEMDLPLQEEVPADDGDDSGTAAGEDATPDADGAGTEGDPSGEDRTGGEDRSRGEDRPGDQGRTRGEDRGAEDVGASEAGADGPAGRSAGAAQPVAAGAAGAVIPAQGRGRAGAAALGRDEIRPADPEAPEPMPLGDAEFRAALEAIMLVVDEPVAEMQLAQILEQPTERVAAMLEDISAGYTAAGHGFDLRRAAGGWRLYTRPEYAAYVERFVLDGQSVRLTQAALETLAVVAYKQPVTRSRISAIRGVNCDGVMRTLATRGLIEECGTEGETGAHLYRTTSLFLEKLGLNSVDQLPPLAPFLPDDVEEVLDASG